MVILGTLVGGLVIAMYLPIFKLGAVDLTARQAQPPKTPRDARRFHLCVEQHLRRLDR